MRQLFALALVCAFAFARVSAECNGKTSPDSYVGDVSVEDYVIDMSAGGWVAVPGLKLGASAHSFEMDVFTPTGTGCLFSFGTPNTANYIEARANGRKLEFQVGTGAVVTTGLAVMDVNRWQHITFVLDNSAHKIEIWIDNVKVAPDQNNQAAVTSVAAMNLGLRQGAIGKCASFSPIAAIDNFFITNDKRTFQDIEDTLQQFFPVVRENALVVYFGFNEPSGNAKSLNGQSTNSFSEATVGGAASRKLRNAVSTVGGMTTDKFCQYGGSIVLDNAQSTIQAAPYYKTPGGGYTNTLDCSANSDSPSFIINQRWDDNGAIIGVSIFSHARHRWQVTPGPVLKVQRADWGGWLQVAESIGVLEEDRSTYIVGKNEFQLQIAGAGWVRVKLDSPTQLSYQYSVYSKGCASAATRDMCKFKVADKPAFTFSGIPMVEPMGLANTTASVANLPATLACPVPSFDGPYPGSPYTYCDRYNSWYGSYGNMRCCQLGGRDDAYPWCPPSKNRCWNGVYQDAECCSLWKYQTNNDPSSPRLMYCPITNDDCWKGQYVDECCKNDAFRYRDGKILDRCTITERDCWEVSGVRDPAKCCGYNYATQQGLKYYKNTAQLQSYCPLTYDDCWSNPGQRLQEAQIRCCSSQFRVDSATNYRLNYCNPTQGECWRWFTSKGFPRQEDQKCCTADKRYYTNSQGQKLVLPWCTITNAECQDPKIFDERCCQSDALKYKQLADSTFDYTVRVQYCTPTTDDCWGWQTNPAKFPKKVEDQRCCQAPGTRYNPNTLQRLDYCDPNFNDCWGFYVMSSLRDEDQRCCKSFPGFKTERLPYCAPSTPVPPPPPVAPPPPPVLKTDVCVKVPADKLSQITSICNKIWGTDQGATQTCIATMCKNDDPTTPPIPDCRVERLLKAANPAYVLPKTCTEGCPNGCYGHGSCNTNTRQCACDAGWAGADCSIPTNYNKCNFTVRAGAVPSTLCQPFPVTYQNKGITTMLTRDFTNVTVQYYDMTADKRMKDTVVVYMIKTVDTFEQREEQFHMVIVNNDGTGAVDGSYTMTLNFAGSPTWNSFGWANINKGATAVRNNNQITVTAAWAKTQFNGVVLFNITRGAAPQFTLSVSQGSKVVQVVMDCMASTGAIEVNRLPSNEFVAPASVGFQCQKLDTSCNAADCKSCAALPNCGWCVETGSCQPGAAQGPFVGQCFNWRFKFDAVTNRRLTIIPGYPTNPRLTDVFLTTQDNTELPIEIGVTAVDPATVAWDLLMFNTFNKDTQSAYFPQGILKIIGAMSEQPNAGIALANLRADSQGYTQVKPLTNPRDYTGIPAMFAQLDSGVTTPLTGALDVIAALKRAADPNTNTFGLRSSARKVFLVITNRAFVNTYTSADKLQVRQRLLDANVALVFAVPQSLTVSYTALAQELTLGRVVAVKDDLSNIDQVVPQTLSRAASSVGVTAGVATGNIAVADFNARVESYTIDNLRAGMRAKFVVPVQAVPSFTGRQTVLYFPSYGMSTVETVATDAPVGDVQPSFDGWADKDLLVELKGHSFRNLFKVSFNVTRLPTKGSLFIAQLDNNGNWIKSATLPNSGEITTVPVIVPFANLYYRSNNALGEGAPWDSFDYKVIDGCTESVAYTVNLNMWPSARPPVAEMPGPRGSEGTPMLIRLGYSEPDGDSVLIGVTRGLYDVTEGANRTTFPIGKFCLKTAAWDAGNFDAAGCQALVAPFNLTNVAQVTGGAQELIYVPPYYGHSFANPVKRPELLIIPCFSYKVYETSGKKSVSNELDVQIILDHVNQAPFVWGDPQTEVRDALFKFNFAAAQASSQMECVPTVGGATCTWDEDFGQEYWWNAGYRYISLGGYDIETSDMEAQITDVNCPVGAILTPWYDDSANIVKGTRIPGLASGKLFNFVKFRPGKEEFSSPAGATYCSFSYRVKDAEGALSKNVATVNIVINKINKPPRMSKQVLDVTVYEQRPQTFVIDAADPEGQSFETYLVGCASKKGQLAICVDYSKDCSGSNLVVLNCNNIGSNGLKLPAKTLNAPSADIEYIGVFTAPLLASTSEGLQYESVQLEFRDGSAFVPHRFVVNFNVIKINQAPTLYLTQADGSESANDQFSFNLPIGQAFSAKLRAADSDIGFGTMDVNVTLDDTFAGAASIDLGALGQVDGIAKGFKVQKSKNLWFRGSLVAVNKLLAAISVNMQADMIPESGFGNAVLTISVSDNGFTGQCPEATSFSVRTCALADKTTIKIQWAKPGNNNSVTVAASASAAAFAGVAAVAAALLFRKLNQRASDAYEPWVVDDNDDGVVDNPLFVSAGTSGDNPLFEGQGGDGNGGL